MLVLKIILFLGIIFLLVETIERIIRKNLGLAKRKRRKEFFNKYERWINFSLILLFSITSYNIGYDSPYIYIVIFIYTMLLFGVEAIFQKKYIKDSKEYIVTITIGIVMTVLLLTGVYITEHYGVFL